MNSFNWSDYEDEDFSQPIEKPKTTSKSEKKESIKNEKFDWEDYGESSEEERPYFGQYAHLTPSEYEKLSPEKKKELQEYNPITGFFKGLVKGATAGATEHFEPTKLQEHETGSGLGEFLGAALPIGLTAKALSIPFKMSGLLNYAAGRIGLSAATGATYSIEKQAIKGEGIKPIEIAAEAAEFGIAHSLFEAVPAAYRWIKSLKTSQQAEALVEGLIPKDLTPNQYKIYETEIAPEIQKVGQQKYQEALQQATEVNEQEFAQKMANVKAQHEDDLFKRAQEKQLSQQEYQKSQKDYENKLKQVAAEHEAKVEEIQKQNQIAEEQFQKDSQAFEEMKTRQKAVDDSIGEMFSPEEVKSYREAGETNIKAIRANDAHDYNEVRNAYQKSEQLNGQVTIQQPNLVQDLLTMRKKLTSVPKLSPPQEQMLTVVERVLNDTAIFSETGNIIGFKQINNNILEEQAKALRYFMDFNFEHGNTRGIFQPLVNKIEDAIELGANFVGNIEAANANKEARRLYRQWAQEYDNDYMRPFRDTSNEDYNKLFYSILDPDNFAMVDKILQKSNAGQQVSKMNKRAFAEKHFSEFIEQPEKIGKKSFKEVLKKTRGVIKPEEELAIKEQLGKLSELKEPKRPTMKELPRAEIPINKAKLKEVPEITEVKIPTKKEVKATPEMRAAEKIMKITPEQARTLTNTPSGLKELKSNLPDKLFEKLGKTKIREIFQKGKIQNKFTGKELYDVINEGSNYEILAEILGEEKTAELLVNSREISSKQATVDAFKKVGTKLGTLKTLILFGIL